MSRLSPGDAPTAASSRSSSMEKIPQLVGQLNSDGTAILQADPSLSLPGGGAERPRAMKLALDAVARRRYSTGDTPSEMSSEEDYDALQHDPGTIIRGGKGGGVEADTSRPSTPLVNGAKVFEDLQIGSKKRPGVTRLKSIPVTLNKLKERGKYILTADDTALREILRAGVERVCLISALFLQNDLYMPGWQTVWNQVRPSHLTIPRRKIQHRLKSDDQNSGI